MITIRNMTKLYPFILMVLFLCSCVKSKNPLSGDIYFVENDDNSYTTWKIIETKGDLIWYIKNDYDVSERSLIDSIEISENYTDSSLSMNRKDFYEKQNIYLLKTQLK